MASPGGDELLTAGWAGEEACAYCGEPATHDDHVWPLARGGPDGEANIAPACGPCNLSKSTKLLTEWDPVRVAHGLVASEAVAAEYARLLAGGQPLGDRKPRRPGGPRVPNRRALAARIPVSLLQRVNAVRGDTGQTHEMWFLDALDRVWDAVVDEYAPAPLHRSGRVPARGRLVRRPAGEPITEYSLRLTADERAALDECYRACRAPSMADLVTTIVRLGLATQSTT